jgi:hypothetical protein
MPLHDRAAKSELPECYYVGGSCLKWDLRPDLSHGREESEVPECYSISALELSRSIMHRYLQTMGFKKERKKTAYRRIAERFHWRRVMLDDGR